jgi:drug/metabolite transporter (DMT)-like permease
MTAIFIRYLTYDHQLPTGVLCFWRAAFLVGALLPALAWFRPQLLLPSSRELPLLVGQGVLLAVFNLVWTTSVTRCGAALSTVLVYTSGPFTVVFGRWLLKETIGRFGIGAAISCLLGCVMTSGITSRVSWHGDGFGVTLGLTSGALYALYTVLSRILAKRGVHPWSMVLYAFSANALTQVAILAAGPLLVQTAPGISDLFCLGSRTNGWLALAGLAIGPTLLGFGLYAASLRYLLSSEANLVLTLEPPLTVGVAYVLFGEWMTRNELLGSGLILLGVLFLHQDHRSRGLGRLERLPLGQLEPPTGVQRKAGSI